MAYTFGAATSDDATWTESGSGYGTSARSNLICGWFYPTTLTATRTLWSAGAINRCSIATVTSELDLFVDRTTDTQHTTSGLGLATNAWHFIAVLASFFTTGVVTNYRIWRGVGMEIPRLVTVNVTTAGAGASTSGFIISVGNAASTGTVSFQGDIGRFDYVAATANNTLCRNATGLISAEDEFAIYTQLVIPIWKGQSPTFYNSSVLSATNGLTHVVQPLVAGNYGRSIRNCGTIQTMDRALTPAGATISANREPIIARGPIAWPDMRR